MSPPIAGRSQRRASQSPPAIGVPHARSRAVGDDGVISAVRSSTRYARFFLKAHAPLLLVLDLAFPPVDRVKIGGLGRRHEAAVDLQRPPGRGPCLRRHGGERTRHDQLSRGRRPSDRRCRMHCRRARIALRPPHRTPCRHTFTASLMSCQGADTADQYSLSISPGQAGSRTSPRGPISAKYGPRS